MNIGDEMNLGGVMVRIVRLTPTGTSECCRVCPLRSGQGTGHCSVHRDDALGMHPADCTNFAPRVYPVYVSEIPRLVLKGLME